MEIDHKFMLFIYIYILCVNAKDYCITGRANPISCAVGHRLIPI